MSESAIKQRTALKSRLSRFKTYVDGVQAAFNDNNLLSNTEVIQLQNRLKGIRDVLTLFEEVQLAIDDNTDNLENSNAQLMEFETKYFDTIALAESLLNQSVLTAASQSSPRISESTSSNFVKLPAISLPKFTGKAEDWLNFKDIFFNLIHNNDNIHRFHYLRASCIDRAADVIKNLSLTSNNYSIAWDLLKDRYDNRKLLVHHHMKSMFEAETIAKESSFKIRQLVDCIEKNLRSLDGLVGRESLWESFLTYLVYSKIDSATLKEFENLSDSNDPPTYDKIMEFLKKRASLLETIEQKRVKQPIERPTLAFSKQAPVSKSFLSVSTPCLLCHKSHSLYSCDKFKQLEVNERRAKIKQWQVCFNCLHKGHFNTNCHSKVSCSKCKARHHTLVHIDQEPSLPVVRDEPDQVTPVTSNQAESFSGVTSSYQGSLLPTVLAKVLDAHGNAHFVRALLDSGSMSSFVTKDFSDKLKVIETRTNVQICGIQGTSTQLNAHCRITLYSMVTKYKLSLSCYIIPNITGSLPIIPFDTSDLIIPSGVTLADPNYNTPGKIDMLIGVNHFWDILFQNKISLGPTRPILQNTRFGYILSGAVPLKNLRVQSIQCNLTTIEDQLMRFWELEEIPNDKLLSQEEKECEAHFVENVQRDIQGRFIVSIPFKDDPAMLGDSLEQATRRFHNLEKRFALNSALREQYSNFMREYEERGHMTLASSYCQPIYHLPHHGIIKEESLTTKLRVVFDGSALTSNGISLNNIQKIGPVVQSDLFSILLRFRKYAYAYSADIQQMYRQVLVDEAQRPLQSILWRFNKEKPLKTYNLNTITYGTASASFLATRCLKEVSLQCAKSHPRISKIILEDFYVDDLLSGADSLIEAQSDCKTLNDVLNSYCFPLRKWLANDPRVVDNIDKSHIHPNFLSFDTNAKTLGLLWDSHSDNLLFSISNFNLGIPTKRSILSDISGIFDPLGLISPCVMGFKFLLQGLWLEKLAWDDPLPEHLQTLWSRFRDTLPALNDIRIPRLVLCKNPKILELHAFCDASMKGYGACLYIRSIDSEGYINSRLLCSKGKVAPLKCISVPRLELCGALLLARLVHKVIIALNIEFNQVVFWTDSTIVLGWLKMPPNRLKIFVANRVVEVQELSKNACWNHISSADNPADLLSRGITAVELTNATLWFNGPSWLNSEKTMWPQSSYSSLTASLPEVKESLCTLTVVNEVSFPFSRYSCLNRLKHIVALCLRFKNNCLTQRCDRQFGPLRYSELNSSFTKLLKMSQRDSFKNELKLLALNQPLTQSNLLSLTPFLDSDGLIRVGGRLSNSLYPFSKKHPILISGKHPLAMLILQYEHLRLLHCGANLLLSSVRDKVWITSGRSLSKKVVHTCVKCYRYSAQITKPIMGQLPLARVHPSFPFERVGVDYAGPFMLKERSGRKCKMHKCYICLFICFTTKAIHLELVTDLSTQHFILSLRRFIARRGRPNHIYSDNGTNFVGAKSVLNDLGKFLSTHTNEMSNFATENEIQWHFIPSHSPHFGGLWESGIKSAKYHLRRVLGSANLTFEEFYTVLVQIECILNSRPIAPLSSEPEDFEPLTPGHFLIGRKLTTAPDPDVTHLPISRMANFQRIQQLIQHFWSRWSREYINEVQQKCKWRKTHSELKLGALVLIKDDQLPPVRWKMGRIVTLHRGKDNVARVATILTSNGVVKRSFQKICPLPIEPLCEVR